MENYLWFYILVGVLGISIFLVETQKGSKSYKSEYKKYEFSRRDYIMTKAEGILFRRLEKIAGERYYIFPQIHLSSLLYHKIKGQSWKAALAKIQRKSVDFVLVDRTTLRTMYAIDLDDATHDTPERQERDEAVVQYLECADIPLVRIRNLDKLSDQDMENVFREAHARNEH